MSDWIKIVLPLVAVAMTSVIGFFLGDFVEELRAGRTVVYSVERSGQGVNLRLANISRVTIENAEFGLRCLDAFDPDTPPSSCFEKTAQGGWYTTRVTGPILARRVTPERSNGPFQLGFRVTLAADGRLEIQANSPRPSDVVMLHDSDLAADEPIRLLRAGGFLGFVVLNYFQVLVWSFIAALSVVALVMVIGIIGSVGVFLNWLRQSQSGSVAKPNKNGPGRESIGDVAAKEQDPSVATRSASSGSSS